jgi:phage shock protein B
MEEEIVGAIVGGIAVVSIFLILPWIIFHYMTKWKTGGDADSVRRELLDELHEPPAASTTGSAASSASWTPRNPQWRQNCLPSRTESRRLLADEELRQWLNCNRRAAPVSTGTSATASSWRLLGDRRLHGSSTSP